MAPTGNIVEDLLKQADDLDAKKKALQKEIGTNRDALRLLAKTGQLSAADAKKVKDHYPDRKAKDADADTGNEGGNS